MWCVPDRTIDARATAMIPVASADEGRQILRELGKWAFRIKTKYRTTILHIKKITVSFWTIVLYNTIVQSVLDSI